MNNRLRTFEKKYDELNRKYESVILQGSNDSHDDSQDDNETTNEDVTISEQVVMEINEEENTNNTQNVEEVLEEVEEVEEVEEEVQEVEEEVEDEVEDSEEVEEIEVEFIEKRLKPKDGKGRVLFLITDDEQRDIYTRLEDGEPDEHVGRLVGKNNRPQWF